MAGEWFVVLPDSDAALAAADATRPAVSRVIEHASGRPWLMGHWPEGRMTIARAGRAQAVVAGVSPATTGSLQERLRTVRTVEDADEVAVGLPGCHHLILSAGGRSRVQGSLACVRRVVHARVGATVVASDNARVLAALTGAGWDPEWLALRLASFSMPFPLHESTCWRGVRAVPGDHWLALETDGTAREQRRWSPPEPTRSRTEGAIAVREALTAAVSARTAMGGTVSCDLSGGMDSTSLAFLTATGPAGLVTYRWAENDSGNDDAFYAALAAQALPTARHRVDSTQSQVAMFADLGLGAPAADRDEPAVFVRSTARLTHVARAMAAEGSRLHLGGHGGDELFRPGHTYLHDLARAHPFHAWHHLRAVRALGRRPWSGILRAVAERQTPAQQLLHHADVLHRPSPGPEALQLGWVYPLRMPPWATEDAIATARDTLRSAVQAGAEPLAEQRAQHMVVLMARSAGAALRQASAAATQAGGVPLSAPYLDDQVLTAALSVRLHERYTPWEFKPLLADAMRGGVPDTLLERTTKGEFSADLYLGLRRHRAGLLDLFDGSHLARHGLIDDASIRETLLRPHPHPSTLQTLDATLACERWLRALDTRAPADRLTSLAPVPHHAYITPAGGQS